MQALQPPSQLVLRQQQQFTQQPLLLVNAPDASVASELNVAGVWHLHAGYAAQWQAQQPHVAQHFGAQPPSLTDVPAAAAALVWLPKEKALTLFLLDALRALFPVGTDIWLVGENRGGIKSIHKNLPASVTAAHKVANGNHSLLLHCQISEPLAQFDLADYLVYTDYQGAAEQAPLTLASLPGVFAFPSIDEGSAMLLQHLPRISHGRVLDFACGHGVLGAVLQQAQPQLEVSYLDVSAMALAACAETLRSNQLQGHLIAADSLMAASKEPSFKHGFNYVVSHPPFHTGTATDYSIGQQFLQQVNQHLCQGSELWVVANRFLPWPELIEQAFGHCERVAQDNKFAVYKAIKSVRRASPSKPKSAPAASRQRKPRQRQWQ